jgi:hypothetical protein
VLFGMSLHGLFSMPSAMNYVAPRGVSVVCRLFVVSGIARFSARAACGRRAGKSLGQT